MTYGASDTEIDKYHLDEEARVLPSRIEEYHQLIYVKQLELDDLKLQYRKESAVARKDIISMYANEGTKVTKDMVEMELDAMPALIDLDRRVRGLGTEISYYRGVLSALDTKRSSLNNLVSLYIKDYYDSGADEGRYRMADTVKGKQNIKDSSERQNNRLSEAMKGRKRS